MPAARATADYLAIDLGASSGRAVLGSFNGSRLTLRELHRFPNGPVTLPTGLHWDVPRLFEEVKRSLSLAAGSGADITGIGIDTWGVDYGLLTAGGVLLSPPYHYRDQRTHGLMDSVISRVLREHIYARTGIQFMAINTLYQLLADLRAGRLDGAHTLLFMPDLFNYWLTGVRRSEHTIASTSQLFDTGAGEWARDVARALDLPDRILPETAPPGTPVGPLTGAVATQSGLSSATVIAPASHDTASAVAAVPATGSDWAYISSGTWSLVGRELASPLRTPAALAANFTNERGVGGSIRFHKNVAGLWLLQECQRHWASGGPAHTYEALCEMASDAPPLGALFDPDHPSLAEFGDMPGRIRSLCSQAGQEAPATEGALVRCILESLALKCRTVIDALERLTGAVRSIHIIGGGVQNPLLCRFIAEATARPVLAGPVEATAMGNVLTQALAHGRVSSLAQIRAVVSESVRPVEYHPRDPEAWAAALGRFTALL